MAPPEQYSLPNPAVTLSPSSPSANTRARRSWQSSFSSLTHPKQLFKRSSQQDAALDRTHSRRSARSTAESKWWQIKYGRGMINDIKRRAPYFWSDWKDAWDYRVVPATVYMYFANILPALAFSLDMFAKTNSSFGVNEVLLSSVFAAVIFSVFAAQPLVIVGVTGPITVFNYTVYDIMANRTNYFQFMCWIGIWSLVLHWILAITNSCNGLRYVTRFSCDIFGFYVAFIYLQKGIQVLTRQWEAGDSSAYLSIMISLLVFMTAYLCGAIGESTLFHRHVRKFIEDYGTPLTVIFFTGFAYIGKMRSIDLLKLPTSKAFYPTIDRDWLVDFWNLPVGDVFVALPFAILLTILFWFDHNVSSLIAQGTEFPLKKPAGFHWDIFLLGFTTGITGLLGLPFPNGLIPQAPFHTAALCVHRTIADTDEDKHKGHAIRVTDHVVEQRVSNLAQGLLTLATMCGPLLIVLHTIPQGVLAGLFFVMGVQALQANGITAKLIFLLKDKGFTPGSDPLARIERRAAIWWFVLIELIGFGATFAITQTIAAVGFPVFILLLIPARTWLLPRYFTIEELRVLDAPTASPFTMESVGGNYGEETDESGPSSGSSTASGLKAPSPAEDDAERGQAGLAEQSSRRRSFRHGDSKDEIEMTRVGNTPSNLETHKE